MGKPMSASAGRQVQERFSQVKAAVGLVLGQEKLRQCMTRFAADQQAAEDRGADGLRGFVAGVRGFMAELQTDQPAFGQEMMALFRAGREDLFAALWGLNLTREAGMPGAPTAQMTTAGLMGLDLKRQNDVIQLAPANEPQQQQQHTRDGRDGRD